MDICLLYSRSHFLVSLEFIKSYNINTLATGSETNDWGPEGQGRGYRQDDLSWSHPPSNMYPTYRRTQRRGQRSWVRPGRTSLPVLSSLPSFIVVCERRTLQQAHFPRRMRGGWIMGVGEGGGGRDISKICQHGDAGVNANAASYVPIYIITLKVR